MIRGLNAEFDLGRLTSGTSHILSYLVAILIVSHHTNLAWLILHVIPTEAIAIQSARWVLAYSSLTLAIDKQLTFHAIGIAIHRSHLPLTSLPVPMRQEMGGVLVLVPTGTIHIIAILRQTSQIADAEVTAT